MKAMRHIGTIWGYMFAGIMVFSIWGVYAGKYGIAGGWFAGFVIIGTAWCLNHFFGVITNPSDASWVDMAAGIAVTGTTLGMFNGLPISASAQTLAVVLLGGAFGGVMAGFMNKYLASK